MSRSRFLGIWFQANFCSLRSFKMAAPHTRNTSHTEARSKLQRSDGGFTLLELLVVLGIIALFAGLAGPRILGYLGTAKSSTAQLQINNLSSAIELYYLDTGTYPAQQNGLGALLNAPPNVKNWKGPYLKKADGLKDPWGQVYIYRFPGTHGDFDIFSLGRDKAEGGTGEDGDVTNW